MSHEDKIHNPVEEYMRHLMGQDKPEKPPETISAPTKHLEIKKSGNRDNIYNPAAGNRQEALKVADAIKQSVNIGRKPKEEHIFNIKRHPAGLIIMLLAAVIGYAVVFSAIGFLLPGFADLTGIELSSVGLAAGILMLVFFLAGLIYSAFKTRNYLLNRLVLTDFNVVHVLHQGVSKKKVDKLPVSDIGDVMIQKNGLFGAIFNYGTIVIRTIEGQNDFIFKYAPYPDVYAKAVNDSKLEYLANHKMASL